jgi:polyisoprenoid-binding protein YceI
MELRSILVAIVGLLASASAQDVSSSNHRFTARLRPAGAPSEVEVVDLDRGRDPGTVVVWRAKKIDFGSSDVWRLTDDGLALAAIATKGAVDKPLVRVVREGKLLAALGARELALDPAVLDAWLVREDGGSPRLDLLGRDGRVRSIDLVTGEVALPRDEAGTGPLRVEPEAGAAAPMPYVSNWFFPDVVLAGEALPVHVRGNLPTPAHRFAGFTVLRQENGALLVEPRMQDPPAGTVSSQVLLAFDQTANVFGLAPGTYSLGVAGQGGNPAEVRPLRVLPAGLVASLDMSGGIAGTHLTVRVFEDGRVESAPGPAGARTVRLASDAQRRSIAKAMELLPSSPAKRPSSVGDDMRAYALVWTAAGRPVVAQRDDGNLEPQLRTFVAALDKLGFRPEADSRYAIDSIKSFIEVRTGSGGLLSALGHDHKIMVRRLSGTVDADPSDLASASVVLEIEAGSLAVVDDDSAKDRDEIEKEMNEHVLDVAVHPTIRFDGRKVESTPTVDGNFDVVVAGELTLHGTQRRIRIPGRLEIREDSLRIRGAISLLQSDFGIEPTSAVGGTVKVADKVRIGFDVTAVRAATGNR